MSHFYFFGTRKVALLIGSILALVAIMVGALLAYSGTIITLVVLAGVAIAIWSLRNLEVGLWGVISVATLLPFATLPFKFILTPTLLDLAMAGVVLVYLCQWMAGYRQRLMTTPAHGPILSFMVLAIFAFVVGLQHAPLTPSLIRKFAEFLLSICFSLIVVDYVRDCQTLDRLVRIILVCGATAALIGLILYLIPPDISERFLSSLGRIGYPSGSVLRYIEDNPANPQRAIGTSVDPNAFGGMLAMVGALATLQLVARKPLLGRRWMAWLVFALIIVTLVLTLSRAAITSLAVTILAVAWLRYPRLVWIVVFGIAIIFLLPDASQGYGIHFLEGIQGRDLATQMRFGEYKDAFILLERYPLIGVGFATAPDVDIYLAVSNAYLTIAEEMGFVGLAAFLLVIGVVFWWAYLHHRASDHESSFAVTWWGVHAGLASILVVGLFDHYFVNLEFHPAQIIFWLFIGLALSATRLISALQSNQGLK